MATTIRTARRVLIQDECWRTETGELLQVVSVELGEAMLKPMDARLDARAYRHNGTPVDPSHPALVEWCGQAYVQIVDRSIDWFGVFGPIGQVTAQPLVVDWMLAEQAVWRYHNPGQAVRDEFYTTIQLLMLAGF